MANYQKRPVRYAVVAAGNVAQVAALPAFVHAAENSRLVALVSNDPETRSELRKSYQLAADGDYADFERVLRRARADAVYIATPNFTHRDFVLRAARCGVHVLCDKPLATSSLDCQAMAQTCEENGVKLMVLYRPHFEAANLKALEIARSGKLGKLRLFSAFYSQVANPGDTQRDAELGESAMLDLGVYCINTARHLFDAEPCEVFASVSQRSNTDQISAVLLRFPDDRLAQFCVSNSVAGASYYRIAGEHGDLRVEPAFEYAEGNEHHVTIGSTSWHLSIKKREPFASELVYFSQCILNDAMPEPSAEEGFCDVRVVEAISSSAKSGQPVALPPYRRTRRPEPEQESRRTAFDKPKPVGMSPSSVR